MIRTMQNELYWHPHLENSAAFLQALYRQAQRSAPHLMYWTKSEHAQNEGNAVSKRKLGFLH